MIFRDQRALYGITEGGRERFAYRANAVGSGRRVVLESAPRVGGFAVRRKPPTLSKLFPAVLPVCVVLSRNPTMV